MQKHREVTKDHKRSQKVTTDTNATTEWLAFAQNISLKTQKSPKTKMINRISKIETKYRSFQCHWLPATGFRKFEIQILIKFTVRPSHIQSQNHLQKEWSNSLKAHTWSMAFCYSGFNVQMHKLLLHDCHVRKARMNCCINQNPGQKKPSSQTPKPSNATSCPLLVFKEFKIQIPINFTMRPSHVQGKIHLQKLCFLDIWPYDDEKKNSSKWIGWMEARWMGFSFELKYSSFVISSMAPKTSTFFWPENVPQIEGSQLYAERVTTSC